MSVKRSMGVFVLLFVGSLFISCRKNDLKEDRAFEKSYTSWMTFKKSTNNSYRYRASSYSWTGLSTQTVITVKEGIVTNRSFVLLMVNDTTHEIYHAEEWEEDEALLNTHPHGAAAITLDDIYQKAKTDWLLKRKNIKTYFETNNNGMVSECGYADQNCVDDCFVGIRIDFIEQL